MRTTVLAFNEEQFLELTEMIQAQSDNLGCMLADLKDFGGEDEQMEDEYEVIGTMSKDIYTQVERNPTFVFSYLNAGSSVVQEDRITAPSLDIAKTYFYQENGPVTILESQ